MAYRGLPTIDNIAINFTRDEQLLKLKSGSGSATVRYLDETNAREAMLAATHTAHAPWTLIDFNDQRRGFQFRVNARGLGQ